MLPAPSTSPHMGDPAGRSPPTARPAARWRPPRLLGAPARALPAARTTHHRHNGGTVRSPNPYVFHVAQGCADSSTGEGSGGTGRVPRHRILVVRWGEILLQEHLSFCDARRMRLPGSLEPASSLLLWRETERERYCDHHCDACATSREHRAHARAPQKRGTLPPRRVHPVRCGQASPRGEGRAATGGSPEMSPDSGRVGTPRQTPVLYWRES